MVMQMIMMCDVIYRLNTELVYTYTCTYNSDPHIWWPIGCTLYLTTGLMAIFIVMDDGAQTICLPLPMHGTI